MKAIVITTPGGPEVLQLVEKEVPSVVAGHVLIQVVAAGLNRPDVFQREGKYPAPPGIVSDIPGLEVAGVITQVGEGVTDFSEGDKVCALVAGGGYAEYVLAPVEQCLPLPENISMKDGASLPETMFTVWHNVFERGALQKGETILVHGGSSGIGITTIQLAKTFGAKVIVTVGSHEKGKACLNYGADRYINYKEQDFEDELGAMSIDVILDMIGGEYFPKNLKLLKPDGRLIYINHMKGRNVSLDLNLLMRNRLVISGSTLRSREIAFKKQLRDSIQTHIWPLLQSQHFKSMVGHSFKMEEVRKAHQLLDSHSHIGKIVLEMN